ncbi:probable pectinesterase 8 [Solanum dulcamara]|uniref:probable pectinesterase 8 n=1 Tax=Solanum dulcamara TaxID=45834 RepID=UPI0024857A13|nr:probable pectinesterase 8 [Solanum dulcamara]
MNPKAIYFPIFIAIFAVLASTHFMNLPRTYFNSILDRCSTALSLCPVNRHHHHHHRHDTDDDKAKQSACDKFTPNFPTIDPSNTSILCVDRNGCCNFTTVQAAVDSVGNFSAKRSLIWINNGMYFEKVIIPKTKPNITFQGQGYTTTAIIWNDTANSANGTFYSGSVQVFSTNFIAKNISFMNVAPMPVPGAVGAQAVAIRIAGDEAAFWGCGFFGAQDTLHDDRGRHYFKDCYIQGSIDFIFGNGKSIYENCQLISIASPVAAGVKSINGAVTAHGRATKDENSGFTFVNCTLGGTGRIWLGRAWRPYSTVVFANTLMTDIVAPEGWNDLNDPSRDQTIFYGEYNCSGAGSNMALRAPYVQRLNDTQVLPFLNSSFIDADLWLQSFSS